jgi:type IV pilus assembly protein PilA
MKTELKAKFLQHILNKKNENEGFTLIELLVVIIIIGILSAIALPSFLNQASKAKQSEAKTILGSLNRAQQAFYLENNYFAASADFGKLGLGVKTQTENYKYLIAGGGTGQTIVTNQAQRTVPLAPLKAYLAGVESSVIAATSEATTITLLCEAVSPGNVTGATDATGTLTSVTSCPTGYTSLAK